MNHLNLFFQAAVLGLAVSSCEQAPHKESSAAIPSWRALFDGTGTAGWEMVAPGEFKLENGELVTYGGMGLLWYAKEKFGNCQLRVVFKITKEGDNSGIFFRIAEPPKTPWEAVNKGYEAQILNREDEYHRTGCIYSLTKAKAIVNLKAGEWNTYLITLEGKRTRVEVNGQTLADYTEGDPVPEKTKPYEPDRGPRPDSGYIGLQNHNADTHVHFKEVSVRGLN